MLQAAQRGRHIERLAPEAVEAMAAGQLYKQIADDLGVSIHTVRSYIRRIYEKLHVRTRTEAIAKYFRH